MHCALAEFQLFDDCDVIYKILLVNEFIAKKWLLE